MEALLTETRQRLRDESVLGEYGAAAVRRTLLAEGVDDVPSERTIGRVFERRGLLDAAHRPRRKAPPKGWYLPEVAAGRAELDSFDLVEGLKIKGGPLVEVLNGVSLHGGLVCSWPCEAAIRATDIVERLVGHWRTHGLPDYAQFDNGTVFHGPHIHPDVVGRVSRACLALGVVPVFAPVSEHVGDVPSPFQAAVEGYNGLWQSKVWGRFEHTCIEELRQRSSAYVTAHHQRTARRREAAPERACVPAHWALDLQAHPGDSPAARIVYIRRTDTKGHVRVLGRWFEVAPAWSSRLVRCEVDLSGGRVRVHRLRRRAPSDQPILAEHPYELPRRAFSE
ncbi:MAG: hypothetical protein AAF624_04555 [Bacteroidota bacterium]